ncbi:MAG: CHAD domain-containing protein [Flavobacteriales bacterium]
MKISQSSQQSYLDQMMLRIQTHALSFLQEENANVLHALRVSIKKYRAFVAVLSALHKNKEYKNLLSSLKIIFAEAGKIRELQVNRINLQKLSLSTEHLDQQFLWLEQSLAHSFKAGLIRHCLLANEQHQKLVSLLESISIAELNKWLKKKIRKISKAIQSNADLHEVRKDLKRLLYLRESLSPKIFRAIQINAAFIDELQEIIGSWHDQLRLNAYLKAHHKLPTQQWKTLDKAANQLLTKVKQTIISFDAKIKINL